jgi:L-histidine Nalpha-methyltransferase
LRNNMILENKNIAVTSVDKVVREGLLSRHKTLPSWLFYNEVGDALFQQIMQLPEYYLTSSETEIITRYSKAIAQELLKSSDEWDIIELGAGDGSKTKILLYELMEQGVDFEYHAIDVSENALTLLKDNLRTSLPDVNVHAVAAEYADGLTQIHSLPGRPRLLLFMGANIGNFEFDEARRFVRKISARLMPADKFLIGFDLMKDPEVILAAYNDNQGVTRKFNLNVLTRLNKELNANFNIDAFEHWPVYDPMTGSCKSYLISRWDQNVFIKDLSLKIHFAQWEPVYMEISQKYNLLMIDELSEAADLALENYWYDEKKYFTVSLLGKVN